MKKIRTVHLDFIHKWSRYISQLNLSAVLRNNVFNSIAIYGGGGIGELFYEYLYNTDIVVKCVIDQNSSLVFPYDVEVLTPEQFLESGMSVDAIFITVIDFFSIISFFKPFVKCALIPLYEFIIDVDVIHNLALIEKRLSEHNAKMYFLDMTNPIQNMMNPSFTEQMNLIHKASHSNYKDGNETSILHSYYNDLVECNDEYIKNVFSLSRLKTITKNGVLYLRDVESVYHNVFNGVRFTTDNPDNFTKTIRFFGNCNAVGCFTEDKYTIQSQLQRKLVESPIDKEIYRVLNHSNWSRYPSCFRQILDIEIGMNDTLLVLCHSMNFGLKYLINSKNISFHNVNSAFDRPHDYGEVFFDTYHTNHRGYRLLSEKIYTILSMPFTDTYQKSKSSIVLGEFPPYINKACKTYNIAVPNSSLDDYIYFLQNKKVDCKGIVGAIVMNCNPFTKGHRFLIEQAKEQCDYLYIFVVAEDKSFFPFKDRLKLVMSGTEDMMNVCVLNGGEFIISSSTFPEYFTKESNPNIKINASRDIRVFIENIAPILNIKKRFVGDEPLDPVTNQYNQALLEALPKSGIMLTVISRKQSTDGEPISASRVRKLLEQREFDAISELVPKSTLDYLKTNFDNRT